MKIKLFQLGLIFVLFSAQLSSVFAAIKPNSLFSDGMVLQHGKQLSVWGTANEGQEIIVNFKVQTVSVITTNGKWMV